MKKNFIKEDSYGYGSLAFQNELIDNPTNGGGIYSEMPALLQPAPSDPILEPVFSEPIYTPKTTVEPVFIDDMPPRYDIPIEEPIYNPKFYTPIFIDDNPPPIDVLPIDETPKIFIPQFPDYSSMTCSELQMQIDELNQILMTSRFVPEIREAYENALANAQYAYSICGTGGIKVTLEPCPEPQLAAPPRCTEWQQYYLPNAKCPSYRLVDDPNCGGYTPLPICPDVLPPTPSKCEKLEVSTDMNGCPSYKIVKDPACGGISDIFEPECPLPQLAAPPPCKTWQKYYAPNAKCPSYQLVDEPNCVSDGGLGEIILGGGTGTGTTGTGGTGTTGGTGGGTTGTGVTSTGGGNTGTGGTGTTATGGGGVFVDDKAAKTLPVSKNLQPYIYAGLGIVVILIVSRMLTQKNN